MQRRERNEYEGGMTQGKIGKQLLLFFFPILLGTFFQQLYNTVDAMIVGKAVGKEALAAVGGATGNLINLLVGFFVGVSSGATVVLSQSYGARDAMRVRKTVHTAVDMALVFGALLTGLGLVLSPQMLRLMQTPSDVLPYATSYLRIYFLGMIPQMIFNMGSGLLRAVGDSRRPLFFLMTAALTNIILDVILVIGADMGVDGAAIATVVSQVAAAGLVIATLIRTPGSMHLSARYMKPDGVILGRIVRIGLPAGLQSVMYSISNVMIQTAVNGFHTDVLAGWTAYGKLDGLFWMMVNAFGVAMTTFSGQNFGAGNDERLKKGVRVCLLQTFCATILMSTVLYFAGPLLYRLFTSDPAVIEKGMEVLHFLTPFYCTYICVEVLSGAIRGSGDSLVPTLFTLFGVCLVRVGWLLFYLPHHRTLQTVLWSYPITWILTSCLFIFYYTHGGWLRRQQAIRDGKQAMAGDQ
ncbi:MAG: MATE family efflux transporter [Clostridia bacterium]|nr:MATE family efflux transporter [Clostridia bacterium]